MSRVFFYGQEASLRPCTADVSVTIGDTALAVLHVGHKGDVACHDGKFSL